MRTSLGIAQEALRNVAAHANAHRVVISLQPVDGATVLRITDDGDGFDVLAARAADHFGLRLMADAAHDVDARLRVSTCGRARDDVGTGDGRMIRVMLVDVHRLVRAELSSLLTTAPDVVLMDLSMPVMDGITATRRILADRPGTKIVVLSSFSDRPRVRDAIAAGAVGYVLKDCTTAELLSAVRAAAQGHAPLDPRVAGALLPSTDDAADPAYQLSDRELQVLRLASKGLANKQIARSLGIAERTVKVHLGNVFKRIGVSDRTSAALWAREHLPEEEHTAR